MNFKKAKLVNEKKPNNASIKQSAALSQDCACGQAK